MTTAAKRRLAALGRFFVLAALLCLAGCDRDDRATVHTRNAEQALGEGRLAEALIELHSALKLDPDNAEVAERIADVLVFTGDLADSRFYYKEAYRLDPERLSAAVQLADLIRAANPRDARALVDEVLAQNPNSAWGYIGLAEHALFDADSAAALAAAKRAVELEPDLSDSHWHLARVHIARIREATLLERPEPENAFDAALAEIDRFAELAPRQRWRALAERARVLAARQGHTDEASAAVREAAAEAAERKLILPEFEMLDLALEIAQRNDRIDLAVWALERKVELDPRRLEAWEELADLFASVGQPRSIVYKRLIDALPEEAEPHRRYAREIYANRGLGKAIQYLLEQIRAGIVPVAPLAAETAMLQLRAGRRDDAFDTVARLAADYPESPEAIVMEAWRLVESGRPSAAVTSLREYPWVDESPAALRVIADAELHRRNPVAARAAIERLMALVPEVDLRTQRVYARTLHDTGAYRPALNHLTRLMRRTHLQESERVMMARCLYEVDARGMGRRMLEGLVDQPDPSSLAVLELAAREGGSDRERERLRKAFAKLLAQNLRNREVLTALTRFEIEAGSPERAIEPLETAIAFLDENGRTSGDLTLLLARAEHASGDTEMARAAALRVLDEQPELPDALPVAVALYPTPEDALAAIATLTEGVDSEAHSPARHALLGRLYFKAGNPIMARWSYEQALRGGLELPILKNDLAFLLATKGVDLKRAGLLARQAAEALPNEPGVVDTLGFVLLKLGDAGNAATEFRRALAAAEARGAATAEIHYHLGLALAKLGRGLEAEQAFETALSLGEDFPDADSARRELAAVRGES